MVIGHIITDFQIDLMFANVSRKSHLIPQKLDRSLM